MTTLVKSFHKVSWRKNYGKQAHEDIETGSFSDQLNGDAGQPGEFSGSLHVGRQVVWPVTKRWKWTGFGEKNNDLIICLSIISLSICLSISYHLSVCLSILHLSLCQLLYLCICPSVHYVLSTYQTAHLLSVIGLSISLSIQSVTHPCTHTSIHHSSICLSI